MLLPAIPHIKTITYGIDQEASYRAHNIHATPEGSDFVVTHQGQELGTFHLPIAGKHNVLNALAAIAIAQEMSITIETIKAALACFQGVERRFCYHGTYKGAYVFDDYAHHPKEIESVLKVARERTKGKLIVVFQPHRFTRTQLLWNDFIQTFLQGKTDELIITDIFPASEPPIDNVSSQQLVQELRDNNMVGATHYIALDDNFDAITRMLDEQAQPEDLILLLGAGKIFKMSEKLVKSKR
jgi:UDP-N-acetylmuramate--alanine ligase